MKVRSLHSFLVPESVNIVRLPILLKMCFPTLAAQTECFCVSGIGHQRFTVRVLGDFTEKLAKEFFLTHCVPDLPEALVPNYEWHKIWEVCGGRPQLLLACGQAAAETLNWNVGEQSH